MQTEKLPRVRGYLKPLSSFKHLHEWEAVVNRLIDLQTRGVDSRGGEISCKMPEFCSNEDALAFVQTVAQNFEYLLTHEVDRWDLFTRKNALDFVEDFANHRFWGISQEYEDYFPDISSLKFSYFYSRGDVEPYVLLDENYTMQLYGSLQNHKKLLHFTDMDGLARIQRSIEEGTPFDVSSFTIANRPFFREDSNIIVEFIGNVRAGFRSDIKSYAVEGGRKACNMYRLQYPGHDKNNICYELDSCDGSIKTSLWNEYIATPMEIISYHKR